MKIRELSLGEMHFKNVLMNLYTVHKHNEKAKTGFLLINKKNECNQF